MQKQEFLSKWMEIIKRSSANLVYKQNFVNTVLRAIRNCSARNTYDTAWARAIVEELDCRNIPNQGETGININSTAQKMVKYYWNQTVYFNLRQGSNPLRPPGLLRGVADLIYEYNKACRKKEPVRFEKAQFSPRLKEMLGENIRYAAGAVKNEIIPRFIQNGQGREEFIKYKRGDDEIYLPQAAASAISENSLLIVEAVYYRWAQILEQYNTSPRLNRKVRIIDTEDLRERPLSYFEKYLDIENPGRLCFYCGQPLPEDNLFMDHLIPWSYLCYDDIWNLVYAHRGCRPSGPPPEFHIARLDKRNRVLLNKLLPYVETDMVVGVLQDAVSRGLLRKNWMLSQD